jgi:serine O-acetyltransferase
MGISREKKEETSCYWDQENIIEEIMATYKPTEDNWEDKVLPGVVDRIMEGYETHAGIDHLEGKDLPSKQVVIEVLEDLLTVIFPGYPRRGEIYKPNTRNFLGSILKSSYLHLVAEAERSLEYLCQRVRKCPEGFCRERAKVVVGDLLERLPEIRVLLKGDIQAAYDGDPAAKSIDEVVLSYPCVLAIATYRIAHELYIRRVPMIPRIMTEYAHSETGIDIHPGAKIGKNFFIDHGTGVVIGETAEIGDNTKIYQGVTLGALSFPKDEKGRIIRGRKRHPTIGKNVVIYSGATLLGDETIIGDNAVIGGNVWITSKIPSGTKVTIIQPKLDYKKQGS